MVTTHNQPNWVQPRYICVSRWQEKSRNRHHTRWYSARKLYIPWRWCVGSVCCSLWLTKHCDVVATFSILLFNPISRSQRLSLQVEQMNVELWTTSRCWSNILMLGGLLTSCPVTCVFLRLIVSLKYLQGELKGFMCCCSLSAECVVTAASSAQGKLRKCFSRILVLAFNLARLKNLP